MEHKEGCMCDECIKQRTKERVARRGIDEQANAYINRRGGTLENPPIASLKGAYINRRGKK